MHTYLVGAIFFVLIFAVVALFFVEQESKISEDNPIAEPAPFRVMRLLDRQLENALEVECGVSRHADQIDLPIERIRIRF